MDENIYEHNVFNKTTLVNYNNDLEEDNEVNANDLFEEDRENCEHQEEDRVLFEDDTLCGEEVLE